jgi:hypothetical protein
MVAQPASQRFDCSVVVGRDADFVFAFSSTDENLDTLKIVFQAYLDMLIRPAEPDEVAVACVHVRSWQAAYRTLLPDEYLDKLRPEDRARRFDFATADPLKPRTIVAVKAG